MRDKRTSTLDWSVDDIDKVIHEPARYMILSILYVLRSADFQFIMNQTGLTKGNLSSHMTKLEKADYIKIKKEFLGRKPHTMMSITKNGRRNLENYRETFKKVLGWS